MIQYRIAEKEDATQIAELHALSWEQNYTEVLSEQYLKHELRKDRLTTWISRFEAVNPKQYTLLAFEAGELCGFACSFVDKHETWGTLLDNLHVRKEWQGRGIGEVLMRKTGRWLHENHPNSWFYLSVLTNNTGAIRFYRRMGGEVQEPYTTYMPGENRVTVHRVVWRDLLALAGSETLIQ